MLDLQTKYNIQKAFNISLEEKFRISSSIVHTIKTAGTPAELTPQMPQNCPIFTAKTKGIIINKY